MRIDREQDGKQELDYGVEELDKESKKKKKKEEDAGIAPLDEHGNDGEDRVAKSALGERWELIKRQTLDSDSAFLDLSEAMGEEEEAEGPEDGGMEEPNMENIDDPETHEMLKEMAEQQAGESEGAEQGTETETEGDSAEMSEEEGAQEAEQAMEQGASPEEIMQMLQADGFSEAEIAHIMDGVNHGAVDPIQQKKLDQMDQVHGARMDDAEHARSMKQQEHEHNLEHRKRMNDIEFDNETNKKAEIQMELDHKKRMLDLEYEKAKRVADIEAKGLESDQALQLKMKELEAKHKMQIKKVENEAKSKMKMEDHAQKREEKKDAEKQQSVDSTKEQ